MLKFILALLIPSMALANAADRTARNAGHGRAARKSGAATRTRAGSGRRSADTQIQVATEEEEEEAAPAAAPAPQPAAAAEPAKPKEKCVIELDKCMDNKLLLATQAGGAVYDDYNDMLADIYNGVDIVPFKCMYSESIKTINAKFYYGNTTLVSGAMMDVKPGSIEYYKFLAENFSSVLAKKLPPMFLAPEVLKIANIDRPITNWTPNSPEGSISISSLRPEDRFKADANACLNPELNPDVEGCGEQITYNTAVLWRSSGDITVDKSCRDYETHLTAKLAKLKKTTEAAIQQKRQQLIEIIDEYNANEEAKENEYIRNLPL
ncbi:MAG: hypothetical protein LBT92_02595 [Rickettsiales bacterium]|jgi:hypothetical protein|nr:hypothetical protein [Rickettsiales bacterium]